MKFLKYIPIVALLALTSCATFQADVAKIGTAIKQVVTPDSLDTIEASYGSTLALAVGYRNLCQRKVINKSCWITIAKIQPYEQKAYDAYIVLRDYVHTNPNADATTFVQLAKDAIAGWKSYQAAQGVN